MSDSLSIHGHPQVERKYGQRPRWAAAILLLGLVFGVFVSGTGGVRFALPAKAATAEPSDEHPARELPREWRWERKSVEFDHMYRNEAPQRLGWIRQGGRR